MKTINQTVTIKNLTFKNRLCCSPVESCIITEPDGIIRDVSVNYYRAVAKGGAGLIFQGATAVCENNRMNQNQAGIWSDEQIPELKRLVDAVHEEGGTIFIQLQHAGIRSKNVDNPICPSELLYNGKVGHEMTLDEIHTAEQQFIDAAKRAVIAGYDGLEIHASHGWLIAEFLNKLVNKRTDEYGKDHMLFLRNIYEGIRKVVPESFVVGIRMSGFEPTLEDGIKNAKTLQSWGVDFLDISTNFGEWKAYTQPFKDENFPYSEIQYSASVIRKHITVPMLSTSGVIDSKSAQELLDLVDMDMLQVGKGMMIDPEFANKVLRGEIPGHCYYGCKPCRFSLDQVKCPSQMRLQKEMQEKQNVEQT